ncbi:tetratricopeptide repeat-containing sensor histidine kinase [Parachryseolinea silvisoli]|uniref:tetratricopeptide repeat-containing sensor histidine kinase n=1 Tax=Parachryseolinea silvisoli TaxID=2873601 RepID=UPI0022658FE8|nr:histidine kinase dimerization/phosphoacceptor domain -containing protein [Parachryseolinea silvisoli]MCD9017690.1 ATP-binding protein [Parachryseolinea silvisoli]
MRLLILVSLFTFFAGTSAFGQLSKTKLKELLTELDDRDMSPKNRATTLLRIAGHFLNVYKPDSAQLFLDKTEAMLNEIPAVLTWLTVEQQRMYFERGNKDSAKRVTFSYIAEVRAHGKETDAASMFFHLGYNMRRWLPKKMIVRSEVLACFDSARVYQRKLGARTAEVQTITEIADYLYTEGAFAESEKQIKEAIAIQTAIGDSSVFMGYEQLHRIYMARGQYTQASAHMYTCIDLMRKSGDLSLTGLFYANLAYMYKEMGDIRKSISWYRTAIGELKSGVDTYGQFYTNLQAVLYSTVNALAELLMKQGKSQEALDMIHSLKKDFPPDSPILQSKMAHGLAYCYQGLGDYTRAEQHYRQMIGLLEQNIRTETPEVIAKAYYDVGHFYTIAGRYEAARPYLEKALPESNHFSTAAIIRDTYLSLFKVDSAAGHYHKAIANFQKHVHLRDSLFNGRKAIEMEELALRYETSEKEKSILDLKSTEKLHLAELDRMSFTRKVIVGGTGILLVLFGLLFHQYSQKKRSNVILEAKQDEIGAQNLSLQRLVREKEWLLKELHHRVKNNLHLIASLLNSQSVYLKDANALHAVRDSQNRVQAMSLIHQKLYIADDVASIDMPVYIHELVRYLEDSFDTKHVLFKLELEPVHLNIFHAIPLGLIINEAVTNAIKYAFAGEAEGVILVALKNVSNEACMLTISDNGVGLPATVSPERPSSLGITLMHGLSQDISADFQMNGQNGVTITVCFNKNNVPTVRI